MTTRRRPADWQEDRALLARARRGEVDCFGIVYRRHNRVVLAFLAQRVAEPELAADLLAETFAALLVVVRDADRPLPQHAIAWLLLTARRLLIDSYRRGEVEASARAHLAMEPLVLEDSDLERVREISAETDLRARLARLLPADQCEALCARVIDEQAYPAIAGQLSCSEAVVRKRVSRALATLRQGQEEMRDRV